ncbi:glycosyltransferase [Altererythrobacter salegens]|uniref:Glycosyltransferase n=1 Tax=Croceibacterium salegens TaxID=1737568 RepID=A0A6I4SZB8_9SPHN|nr:glycosyltransferase family 4 protein [Croceibacterium salegens]MXO60739.1 glycosyltransferase [Croceibacterium salegens]
MAERARLADRPLRVALVTTFYPPHNFGGDGRYVQSFARALARHGCEVEVIYSDDGWRVLSGQKTSPETAPDEPGIKIRNLSSDKPFMATLLNQQLGTPAGRRRRLEAALSNDFDVIHYHNVSLIGGPGALELGDAIKFYTAHEHWLVCPNHVLWRHGRELCDGRECVRCSIAHRRPPQLWRATGLLDRAASHVDTFIALSESVAANHKSFGFKPEMTLMASFMPDEEAAASVPAPAHPRPYFLMVGRLEVIKGMQDVIPRFGEDAPADLLIAGSGPFEPELRALAEGKPHVRFLGKVDPGALPELYRNSLALITPSICYEVFPMVALEAFREGTPIVARDLGPYPQIVQESEAGLLFEDAVSLGDALRTIASDQQMRAKLGANGRQAVATRWSEATAIHDYFELIRQTAIKKRRQDLVDRLAALPLAA